MTQLKYFTYELIAAANDWIDQTEQERLNAEKLFHEKVKRYHVSLRELEPLISTQAWNFFAHGYGRWGLHDERLISLARGRWKRNAQ